MGTRRLRPGRRTTGRASGREAYVDFAAGEKRAWLHAQGHAALPGGRLGRARRVRRRRARQLGAALPRHLGHRPRRGRAVRAPGPRGRRRAGLVELRFRHRVDGLVADRRRRSTGSAARVLEPERRAARGEASSRAVVGEFELTRAGGRSSPPAASAATTTWSGAAWPARLGTAADADARRRARRTSTAGCSRSPRRPAARVINPDRMWHYTEGIAQLGPDLGRARHPDPARPVVAVAGRDRPPAAGAAVPRLRHPRHARRT